MTVIIFYASAERLFKPELAKKPIVVLSNNDGCVIARSEEAKACGVKMTDPEFMIRDLIEKHDISVFSSNYALYGDISERVMTNLSRWFPKLDVYSIDEAFGWLGGVPDLHNYIPRVRETVVRNTGIPVSIGVAPTKTLAKLANKLSKKSGGSLVLDTAEAITNAVENFPVENLWGIGRQYYKLMESQKIKTVGQLRNMPEMWIKQHMTIKGQRMWNELWGRPSISIDNAPDTRKGIMVSRSFRNYIDDPVILTEAVTYYAAILGEKLRKNKLKCLYLQVYLFTNKNRDDHSQHFPSYTYKMEMAGNNTHDLVKVVTRVAKLLFKPGISYKKSRNYGNRPNPGKRAAA